MTFRPKYVLLVALVSACGVPASSDFDAFDPGDTLVPPSTTTTTVATTTTTSVPSSPPSTPVATSTTVEQARPIDLAYVVAPPDNRELTIVTEDEELDPDASLEDVIDLLAEVPPDDCERGIQTVVRSDLVVRARARGGVAYVELDWRTMFNELDTTDQELMLAQLVLTLGNLPGIGPVQFTQEREPREIPVPSRGSENSDEPVSSEDFESMLIEPDELDECPPSTGGDPPQ